MGSLVVLMLYALSAIPSVFADFPDGFDTYQTNVQNPGPWTFLPDSSNCWTGGVLTGQQNSVVPQSPPNMYGIGFVAGCGGTFHNSFFTVGANVTSNTLNFTFYANVDSQPSTASSDGIQLVMCGTTEQLFVNGTSSGNPFILISSIRHWTKVSATQFFAVGQVCTGGIQIEVTAVVGDSGGFRVDVDTTNMIGANAISAGVNFFLMNYPSQTWFPISSFSGSSVRVNYNQAVTCPNNMVQASPTVCITKSPLTIPDLNLPLTHATLVTVNIGGSVPYTRTIIPQPNLLNPTTPSSQVMYLDVPAACPSICSYTLTVNDFTNFFPAGTSGAFIQQGGFTITSALLDSQSALAMTMQPGLYNLTLISANGLHTSSQPLSLSATDASPSILIQNGSSPLVIGPFQQFSYVAFWDCDTGGITSLVGDSLGTMTQETFNLYRYNTTFMGGQLIGTNTQTVTGGPGFTVNYDFRNLTLGTKNLNFNTPNEYQVSYVLSTPQGPQNFGRYPIGVNSHCSRQPPYVGSASGFNLPPSVLGLSQLFAVKNAYELLLSLIVEVLTVGIVAARFGHMSMLLLGGEVGIFALMGWEPLAAAPLCPVFFFMGSIGTLANRSRRPIT